jgi:hypothetical protein
MYKLTKGNLKCAYAETAKAKPLLPRLNGITQAVRDIFAKFPYPMAVLDSFAEFKHAKNNCSQVNDTEHFSSFSHMIKRYLAQFFIFTKMPKSP